MSAYEKYLDQVETRRLNADARWERRQDSLEKKAEKLIQETEVDGKTVYSVQMPGCRKRESWYWYDLFLYLCRNGHL